jgi:hypothetical protein
LLICPPPAAMRSQMPSAQSSGSSCLSNVGQWEILDFIPLMVVNPDFRRLITRQRLKRCYIFSIVQLELQSTPWSHMTSEAPWIKYKRSLFAWREHENFAVLLR